MTPAQDPWQSHETTPLPDDPGDLRALARLLIAEVKAQAMLIETLWHQLAGLCTHRFEASSETAEQLQLGWCQRDAA